MRRHVVLLVILLCYDHLFVGTIQSTRSLSKEADLDVEIHKKLLNKPSIKTIHDVYGAIYDCVNVYEQVAFDHPSLQNHTIDFQVTSTMVHHNVSDKDSPTFSKSFDPYLRPETCPVGTIPIQRISKEYLIRERETTNRPNTYLAIARSKIGHGKYSGARGFIRHDNPKVVGQQFSTTRISLQAGADRIEAGWRVDPSFYGDSRSHFFIRTDAGRTHCFNIRCPGFIQMAHNFTFDGPLIISIPGGPTYGVDILITKDIGNRNWNLYLGEDRYYVGYWPSNIFTSLAGFADRVEWGGAAYSPPGTPLPPMGSGNHPIGDPLWDGYIGRMKVINEKGQTIDASNLETYATNSKFYSVRDYGYFSEQWGYLILYGGPGHQ